MGDIERPPPFRPAAGFGLCEWNQGSAAPSLGSLEPAWAHAPPFWLLPENSQRSSPQGSPGRLLCGVSVRLGSCCARITCGLGSAQDLPTVLAASQADTFVLGQRAKRSTVVCSWRIGGRGQRTAGRVSNGSAGRDVAGVAAGCGLPLRIGGLGCKDPKAFALWCHGPVEVMLCGDHLWGRLWGLAMSDRLLRPPAVMVASSGGHFRLGPAKMPRAWPQSWSVGEIGGFGMGGILW